jgi:hypothetical protein
MVSSGFLQEPHGVTTQKTPFFIVTAVKTSNLTSEYHGFEFGVHCFLGFDAMMSDRRSPAFQKNMLALYTVLNIKVVWSVMTSDHPHGVTSQKTVIIGKEDV